MMTLLLAAVACSTCPGSDTHQEQLVVDLTAEDLGTEGSTGDTGDSSPDCESVCADQLGGGLGVWEVSACSLDPLDGGGAHLDCTARGPYVLCE
ncbi:MAG: hypothetical protein ABMA64_33580 [Myxococcota bacterium]